MREPILLLTGFEPFGGRACNASWEAVSRVAERLGPWRVEKRLLPVEFGRAAALAICEAEKLRASALICVGEAGGRGAVTPELLAVNLRYARIPDNAGAAPLDEPCVPGGENALFSALPVRAMAEAIAAAGLPAEVSSSAGLYVCNDLFYLSLRCFAGVLPCGFIHVPTEEVLPPERCAAALEAAVLCLKAPGR